MKMTFETNDNEDYIKAVQGYNEPIIKGQVDVHLDLTGLPISVDVKNIDELPNEEYAMLRKGGLGASDSSIILGVNPYTTLQELITEKARTHLTEEEKAVGEETAVKKGLDLEPLIIKKFEKFFGQKNWKPSDMYRFKDFPYLTVNFDGVTGKPGAYIPCEIKVCTKKGERHYQKQKAMYIEGVGFRPIPIDITQSNNSIQTKALHYGIPPYYYTQIQQQILALNAPFGYLTVLFEESWLTCTYFIHKDNNVATDLILKGAKVWDRIIASKAGYAVPEIKTRREILNEQYEETQQYWEDKKADDKKREIL